MKTPNNKPIHAKPSLYVLYFLALKEIAMDYGYNLVLHGSLNRDLDLIAIPWVDKPKPSTELITALADYLGGKVQDTVSDHPGGRTAFTIDLNRGGYVRTPEGDIADPIVFIEDPQYYIDISVTPTGWSPIDFNNI
jgi:hypothetical protein